MREILFRGKRLDNDEWVYGSFCMDAIEQFKGPVGIDGFIRLYDKAKDKMLMHEVDRETVGQYTGLKDKNGKRIFEGDRVVYPDSTSCSSYDDYNEGIVDYDEETMRFYFTDRWFVEMEDFDVVNGMMVDVQVIGNIHDNQEMLGGGGDG